MNQSKTGLNDSFYRWIDQVRRSKRKLPELQEKLEYYKVKLIGYHGISYDQIGSGTSDKKGDEDLLYWIDKINQVEYDIIKNNEIIESFEYFKTKLNDDLQIVLESIVRGRYINKSYMELRIKRNSHNQKKAQVIRKWMTNMTL